MAGSEEDGKGQVMAIPTLVKIAAVLLVAAVLFAGMANYLPIIRQLASRLGFGPEFQPASLQAGRAVSYAMSCSALANAWRPSITTDDNKEVKRAYRRECSEADVGSNGLDHQLPPDALDDALNKSNTNNRGDIKGKSFGGDVVVQCVSAPNKVKSGCNIYNLELPQKLGEIETLDKPYGMGGGGPLPNVARLTQSPVKWVDFYEAGWGDPKYLMYYQEFPQSLSRKWDASKMSDRFSHEMVILSAGIGAITELVGLGIGGELTEAISKKSIKTAIMGAGSKSADVATTVYRTVSNPRYALDSMQDSVGSMMRRVKPDNLLGGTDNRVSRDKVMETLLEEEGEISVKEAFEAYVGKATYVQGKSQGNIMAGAYDEVADAVDSGVSESVTQDVSEALSKALTKYEGVGGSNLDDLIARSAQGIADDEGLDAFDETVAQNALDVLKNQQDLNKLHTLVTKSDELTSDMSDDVLTAYSRTGAGYGAEDELTEGGLKKELRENIGETFDGVYLDSSDADFVYKMMGGEDYLDNMNSWFNAIKRVTRETMLSESRTVRLMKRGVSRLHGLRSGNSKAVRSLSGETWDSGDEDIFAETFENSHAYRSVAREELGISSGDTLSDDQAKQIVFMGRTREFSQHLRFLEEAGGKSTKRKLTKSARVLGRELALTKGARMEYADLTGGVLDESNLGSSGWAQNAESWARCNTVIKSVSATSALSLATCLGVVGLAGYSIVKNEQMNQYDYTGDNIAVDLVNDYSGPEKFDMHPAANWFMPVLPHRYSREQMESNGIEVSGFNGPAMPEERRFRLVSPCYTDVIKIRHQKVRGQRKLAPGSRVTYNSPSYAANQEVREDSGRNYTTEARSALQNLNGTPIFASKGAYYVPKEVTSGLADLSKDKIAFTTGTMAYMTAEDGSELSMEATSGVDPLWESAPPGYTMPETNFEKSGRICTGQPTTVSSCSDINSISNGDDFCDDVESRISCYHDGSSCTSPSGRCTGSIDGGTCSYLDSHSGLVGLGEGWDYGQYCGFLGQEQMKCDYTVANGCSTVGGNPSCQVLTQAYSQAESNGNAARADKAMHTCQLLEDMGNCSWSSSAPAPGEEVCDAVNQLPDVGFWEGNHGTVCQNLGCDWDRREPRIWRGLIEINKGDNLVAFDEEHPSNNNIPGPDTLYHSKSVSSNYQVMQTSRNAGKEMWNPENQDGVKDVLNDEKPDWKSANETLHNLISDTNTNAQRLRNLTTILERGYKQYIDAMRRCGGRNGTFPFSNWDYSSSGNVNYGGSGYWAGTSSNVPEENIDWSKACFDLWGGRSNSEYNQEPFEPYDKEGVTKFSSPVELDGPNGNFAWEGKDMQTFGHYMNTGSQILYDILRSSERGDWASYVASNGADNEVKGALAEMYRFYRNSINGSINLDATPDEDSVSDWREEVTEEYMEADTVEKVYYTPNSNGVKTLTSRSIKQVEGWTNFIESIVGPSNQEEYLNTTVEGLVTYVDKTDASEVDGIPEGTNYCYATDWDPGWNYHGWNALMAVGEVSVTVGALMATGGSSAVFEPFIGATFAAFESIGRQKMQAAAYGPWPYSQKCDSDSCS